MKKTANSKKLFFMNGLHKKTFFGVAVLLFQLLLVSETVFAQSKTVKGRVVNDTGQPVQKATVQVKGTSNGTTTDDNGDFQLSVPDNATLVISSVNFEAQEIKPGSRTSITVTLTSSQKNLDEVVVIGYGTQRKRDVTGSTISVKGETLNEIKAPNIINQLQGRAAGVDIVTNGNTIGTGGQIRIRGSRSITGNNDPLIVVDGMVYGGSLNDLNPDNVANLDVLKDASATAIYGSRGANGVIIITTKRGTNQKAVTSYNGYVGNVSPIGTYRLFNGAELHNLN